MRKGRRLITPALGFNATPMVDVIFTLTIFFMLVARFSSAEHAPMELPAPHESQARIDQPPERVVINCRLADEDAPAAGARLNLGARDPEPLSAILDRLVRLKQRSANVQAVIRADRRLPYVEVRAVMEALAAAGIEVLNVAAHVDEEGE